VGGQNRRYGALIPSRGGAVGLVSLALLGSTSPARADEPTTAEALFDQGRYLMRDPATLSRGCELLAKSYQLSARGDSLLNLAECHRREGKTATAWAEFDEAIRVSEKMRFSAALQVAKQRREDLAAVLSTLTIEVAPEIAALPGLAVELNGKPLSREKWNTASSLDPGPFEITAVATDRVRFTASVVLGADKDRKVVSVILAPVPRPPAPVVVAPPPPPQPPPPPPPPPRPIWPWVVGATGVALLGGAAGARVVQTTAGSELDVKCGVSRRDCPAGVNLQPVRMRELLGFGFFVGLGGVGLAAIATGGIGLGLTRRASKATAALQLGPGSLVVAGGF
jgi:hypothetical protein